MPWNEITLRTVRSYAACNETQTEPFDDQLQYSIARYVLVGLYVLLSVSFAYQLFGLVKTRGRHWQKIFHFFVVLGCIGRAIYWALQPSMRVYAIHIANCVNTFLYILPTYLFFSAYFVIIFFWSEVGKISSSHGKIQSSNLMRWFIILNTLLYMEVAGVYIAVFVTCDFANCSDYPAFDTIPEQIIKGSVGVIYLILAMVYAYWAYRFYESYRYMSENSLGANVGTFSHPLVKLILLSCLFAGVFIVRMGFIIDGMIGDDKMSTWWFDPIFFLFCEVIPILLMYAILKSNNLSGKNPQPVSADMKTPLINEN